MDDREPPAAGASAVAVDVADVPVVVGVPRAARPPGCRVALARGGLLSEDKRVVQCNYAVATKVAPKGARAYVSLPNRGNGHDRIMVLVRSHGGRWVRKWEDTRRLTDFRVKTIPPEHPLYGDERLFPAESLADLLLVLGPRKELPTGDAMTTPDAIVEPDACACSSGPIPPACQPNDTHICARPVHTDELHRCSCGVEWQPTTPPAPVEPVEQ